MPATVTVQQLQQIVKSVAGGGQGQPTQQVKPAFGWMQSLNFCSPQIISHAVLAKPGAPGQTVQARVLPVSGVAARQGQQTIQVLLQIPIFLTHLLFIIMIVPTLPTQQPGGSSSARHGPRQFTERLPRPAWPASGQCSCQRPRCGQPRQDPGAHGE